MPMTGLKRGVSLGEDRPRGAPVRNTHKMPFITDRRLFQKATLCHHVVFLAQGLGSRIFHC